MVALRSAARPALALAAAVTLVSGMLAEAPTPRTAQAAVSTAEVAVSAQAAAPKIKVTRIVGGLKIPWDVTFVGGVMLYNQRAGSLWTKRGSAAPKRVRLPLPRTFARSEGGLLGLVADPGAATNKLFYTCQAVATATGKAKDIEVWKWRLTSDTRAVKVRALITGLPLTSGRHSGCRLRFRSAQMLYVGTGDAVRGTNPQRLGSLGGKILRVRSDGAIPTSNPFYRRGGNARYVFSYGHRNVQGLAKRPGRNELWSVEQGTSRDDEVNLVTAGGNYGWDPVPGYNEARSMTDKRRHPRAIAAKWRSGSPTVATCGATFLSGARWGSWNGVLAVAMLKGQGVKLLTINGASKVTRTQNVLRSYGRIRTVQQGPGGALYFTTANGSRDGIYRVTAG